MAAAGDAGGALGAALYGWHQIRERPRTPPPTDSMAGAYLGPEFADEEIRTWLDDEGMPQEKVFNVALADGRVVGSDGKAPPVGNTVDISTGNYTNSIGDPELMVVWSDPEFDAAKSSFYYVRVLQIPTPRHTLFDAIALGIPVEETGQPAAIQERAYSSPIWYTP